VACERIQKKEEEEENSNSSKQTVTSFFGGKDLVIVDSPHNKANALKNCAAGGKAVTLVRYQLSVNAVVGSELPLCLPDMTLSTYSKPTNQNLVNVVSLPKGFKCRPW